MDPIIVLFYGRREYTNTDDKHDNKHTRLMNTVSNLRTLAAMTISMDTCIYKIKHTRLRIGCMHGIGMTVRD